MSRSCKSPRRNTRFSFTLKDINPESIDRMYNIVLVSNLCTEGPKVNITKLSDLTLPEDVTTFIDNTSGGDKSIITMKDYIKDEKLPEKTNIKCFWCRSQFITSPIGCPVKYVPDRITKTYYSCITKDVYTLTDELTYDERVFLQKKKESTNPLCTGENIIIEQNSYYETDGIFCSFDCCFSFIEENSHIPLYKYSKFLLLKMYSEIFNKIIEFKPAPHWRLSEEYGGPLSIKEFRESFNKSVYLNSKTIIRKPKQVPIGFIFQKKIRIR